MNRVLVRRAFGILLLATLFGCGPEPTPPLFPADYAKTYSEVRDCRRSGDHDLNHIRIVAPPGAADTYRSRSGDFVAGAVILKEEYDFGDDTCTGPIVRFTVMRKRAEADTSAPGWSWQRVAPDRKVLGADEARCVSCHTSCGVPPQGYQGTCAVP